MADKDTSQDPQQDDSAVPSSEEPSSSQKPSPEDELMKKINDLKASEEVGVHDSYQEQIEVLEAKVKEADDRALRSMAELKNAQQRMETEKSSFAVFATQKLILQVLEVYENYHRLMAHKPEDLPESEWLKGLELIDQQFVKFMEQQGVMQIESNIGGRIDPEKHEAMMTDEGEKDVILEVFSEGFEMNGRVIKTAKVKVGKG
ncbi:MAG: nucleotide exchange factor GrpE [Candidatus Gracilibacteria bacterium]|nr:nucleotide exchange factor GrpE [Candidatus Gracilibacteria bacterium]